MKTVLFCGGGSAGHVIPNLALMRELRYAYDLLYMGTDGIEKKLVRDAGYPFFTVETPKLSRSFSFSNLKIPFALHRAKKKALLILKERRPDLVFSKGGYASYPAVWAAYKLKIPVLTHESDLSPGLCTKLIAKKCDAVLTSFPETANRFKNGIFVGSPVRREVLSGDRTRARKKFGFPETSPVLLVFGGGSGSRALNEAINSSLPRLTEKFSILHITGREEEKVQHVGDKVYISRPFERDMGSALAAADIVLCRAGSNTVFELLSLKKRAVLVPLAHASRGDQWENARYFEEKGLVKILPEEELARLPEALLAAIDDAALGENLKNCDIASGTQTIVRLIKEKLEDQPAGGERL